MDKGEQERANDFWSNAYAYAMQSAPYAQERLDALNQSSNEVLQQLVMLPEEEQKDLFERLKDDLVKPIEGQTAKEYDAAFKKMQGIVKELHKKYVPALPAMMPMGMPSPMGPTGPGPAAPSPLGQLQPNPQPQGAF